MSNIWKDKSITLATKKRLLNSLVFPIATYGLECWVMKASDRKRLESFELWCYRRILCISWTERKTDEFVLGKSGLQFQGDRLANTVYARQLGFIGHVLRHESLEKTLLIGMVLGKRGRGRPKTRLCDHLKTTTGMSMVEMERAAQDRNHWRMIVREATAARQRATR